MFDWRAEHAKLFWEIMFTDSKTMKGAKIQCIDLKNKVIKTELYLCTSQFFPLTLKMMH